MVGFVGECLWPRVNERDPSTLDERTQARIAELSRGDANVRYFGSLRLRNDEVSAAGSGATPTLYESLLRQAAIPFERILETAESPWPLP